MPSGMHDASLSLETKHRKRGETEKHRGRVQGEMCIVKNAVTQQDWNNISGVTVWGKNKQSDALSFTLTHTHLSHIFPSVTELSTDTQQNLRLVFQITALFCINVSLYSFTIWPMNKWVMCAIINNKYDSPYDSFHLMSPANTHFSKCCHFPYMEIFLPPNSHI